MTKPAMEHFGLTISPECAPSGSGQCDGTECTDCPCHDNWDLPITVAGVKVWHDNFWGISNGE